VNALPPETPYSKDLGARDPVSAMRETVDRVRSLTAGWAAEQFERSYAPGKWSARLILTHLAQSELALGNRIRMALSVTNYIAQPFDQDVWIARESHTGGMEAANAFIALSRMNVVFFESLSPGDRRTTLAHPEYGTLTVDWIIHQIAGHQVHHLAQLEKIGSA